MPDLTISSLSTVYVHVPVRDVLFAADPTTSPVQVAFPARGVEPVESDWRAADWRTDSAVTPPVYYARCLVGPMGTVQLADGLYDVWVRVTDNPERPVLRAPGGLVVT